MRVRYANTVHSPEAALRLGLHDGSSMSDLRDLLQASLGSAYTLDRELGGGGMSRVFLAEDTALGRHVVVKILPHETTGAVSAARFEREIAFAARLQHPHIVPLLSAGQADGVPFYTMPYIEGESLRTRLAGGALPIADVVSILRDVARALEYAHEKGVTHRDIKPDNVLLAGRSAMITDLGVAKAVSDAATGTSLTTVGVALGTPAYMAPEQAAADPATDQRADIYAFGVMAYEMLAGHTPFSGRSVQSMLAAHATEMPTAIVVARPATPPALAQLVMRCLEKQPGDRPQSAREVVGLLEDITLAPAKRRARARPALAAVAVTLLALVAVGGWALWHFAGGPGRAIPSIAVLPFENTSGDTAYDYLQDGISDHVRDALMSIPNLSVKARSSSRLLRGRDAREVGQKLSVAAVLQGEVSRSASRLHVTAELVRVSDDVALWSATFDGQPDQLAGIQDTIMRAVTHRIAPTLASSGGRARGARGTNDIQAYDLFLRGHYAYDRLQATQAAELFSQAIAKDPTFARAYAYLAMADANTPTLGVRSVDSMNAVARANIGRALQIDSTLPEAYVAESFIATNEMRFADAIPPLTKALAIDTSNVDVVSSYALALAQVGDVQHALEQAGRAVQRDPLSSTALGIRAYCLFLSGRADSASVRMREAGDLDPFNVLIRRQLGNFYAWRGMIDSSVHAFEAAYRTDSTLFGGRVNLLFAYAVAGRWRDVARQRALMERESAGNSPNYRRMVVALVYGQRDAALTALEQGVANREPLLGIISLPCDPLFDPLKSDPRFSRVMRTIGARACPVTMRWPVGPPR